MFKVFCRLQKKHSGPTETTLSGLAPSDVRTSRVATLGYRKHPRWGRPQTVQTPVIFPSEDEGEWVPGKKRSLSVAGEEREGFADEVERAGDENRAVLRAAGLQCCRQVWVEDGGMGGQVSQRVGRKRS